jgi:hypothetical protein
MKQRSEHASKELVWILWLRLERKRESARRNALVLATGVLENYKRSERRANAIILTGLGTASGYFWWYGT